MTHRGPDHYGSWESKDKNLILSSSRLALNDLSSNGHQPMSDHTDKYKIVFNGEIYNFKSLKKELLKNNSKFINNSDTEVILEGYKLWGIDTLLKKNKRNVCFQFNRSRK